MHVRLENPRGCVVAVQLGCFIERIQRSTVIAITNERFRFVAPGNSAARVNQQRAAVGIDSSSIIAQERSRIPQAVPGLEAILIIVQYLLIGSNGLFCMFISISVSALP